MFRIIALFVFFLFDQSLLGMCGECYTPTDILSKKVLYENGLKECNVGKAQQAIDRLAFLQSNKSIRENIESAINSVATSICSLSNLSIDDEYIKEQIRRRVFSLFFALRDKLNDLKYRIKLLPKGDKVYINELVGSFVHDQL